MKSAKELMVQIKAAMELPATESKPQKIGRDEEKLQEVIVTSPKVSQVDLESLKKAMAYCFIIVGLREQNFPKGDEKLMLIDFVLTHYAGHTLDEIRLAFSMAVAGKLGVDANCYENFSVLFFAKIMSAYRLWAEQTVPRLPISKPEPVRLNPVEEAYYRLLAVNKLPCKVPVS